MVVVLGDKVPFNFIQGQEYSSSSSQSQEEDQDVMLLEDLVKDMKACHPSMYSSSNHTHATEGISLSFSEHEEEDENDDHSTMFWKPVEIADPSEEDLDDDGTVSQASTISGLERAKGVQNQNYHAARVVDHEYGIPSEIIVIHEIPLSSSSSRSSSSGAVANQQEAMDIATRLQVAECKAASYKNALEDSERIVESMQKIIDETRIERDLLLAQQQQSSAGRSGRKMDLQESNKLCLLKIVLCLGLVFHLCFGSDTIFVIGAAAYLFDDALNRYT